MDIDLTAISRQVNLCAGELLEVACLRPGQILVVGCSTSEVHGARIGTAGSAEVAEAILTALKTTCQSRQVHLAVQCCEHLNRALVVKQTVADHYGLEVVSVVPMPKAGGALAARAIREFVAGVVVETIQAHAG